ncbi:synaptotagmin-like protein 2 isoform X5 [Ursus americanus]|uniref:synaptotagmin-like protein 2 isoform X5 n=1 Tax=Ursus americanus TaxID=9643 RepID=UPI001E67B540|nr:synaptotagmin-like protein 2 isoform X5 [Ursus americanus]
MIFKMIDLSFLTEEEQEAIMKVLQRDAALKRVEEERVRHLPEKIKDDQQLKNMSGQWFYEAKAKRHRDRIHGADIIRASMRKKKLQVEAEQSKDRANEAKESWVNNVNKHAFLPPELTSAVEEPEDVAPTSPSSSVVNPASTMIDTSQENTRKTAVSPAKQRKNPFNSSKLPEDHLSQQTKSEPSKNGKAGFFQTSKEGELSESKEKSSVPDTSSQNLEKLKPRFPGPENGSQVKPPIPKARKMLPKPHELKQDDNQSFPRQRTDSLSARGAPRGILKRNSSSSSTDSETVRFHQNLEPKSKIVSPGLTIHERISEKEHCLDDDSSSNSLEPLKHVRFSAVKDELPQSPGLSHGREVGEFSILESDRLKNGTEDIADVDELWNDPKPSQNRNSFPLHQSASSPSASNNKAHQPMTSGSFSMNGHHSPSEGLTPRPESIENSPTINEHKAKPSELSSLEGELSKSPADGLSCVEPEPFQVPDHSSRDRQQGKPPLLKALKARTSSHSDPFDTEIRKTTDDSISKVLDWFNRSSHSEDNKSPLQHPQGIELKEETNSESLTATALERDDTSLKEKGSKALLPTKVKLMPAESDSTFQGEGNTMPSRTCQNNNVNIKPKSINLSQQGKESPGILQPCEIYGQNQGSKTMDYSQSSKHRGEGNRVLPPISNYSYSALKGPDAEDQIPCNIRDVDSLGEEEPKLHVYGKNRGNSEVNFDSTLVKEPTLKDNMEAERESKGGDTYFLKASLEPDNIESLHGATKNKSWKKPEVQLQEAGEVPKNQVQREKYKRVSERISFWEGEKATAKLTHKEPTSSCSQGQPSAKAYQPVKSMHSLSTGQSEYNQVTSKQVVLDKNGHTAHLSSFCSSNKPKENRPQIPGSSKNYPSGNQPGEVPPFQNKINEPIKRLPVAESWHYKKDITLPAWQHPSNIGNATHTPLEKDKSLIGESNPNFKVTSLKQRMDESNTEQVYNHSQFEHLRKFWDSGANPNRQENVEKNTITVSQKYLVSFNSQKHKEFSDIVSSGKTIHEIGTLPGKKEILASEEIEKLNSKCTLQVLPDETTFPLGPSRKSTHHLPGNESSEENVEKNTKWFVTPVFKEEKDYSDQEIQESIVKTSVLSKDHKDTFNDNLQKLLSEASSLAMHPSGGKVHEKQMSEPGISGNKTWPQDADFADTEEEDKGHKETINEHVDKTVAPPKVKLNTLTASLDKLLKEATGTSSCPLPIVLKPATTRINSEPEEGRVNEKGIEWNSTSAYQKDIVALFPKGNKTLVNTAVSQKAESGQCQLSMEDVCQVAAEGAHPSGQPSHLYRKDYFGDVANSPQEMPSSRDAHLAPQDKALSSQREISETVEKVILPPKPALNDVNAVLQKLLREACYPAGREVVPGEVKAEFPEGVQAAGSPQNSPPWATMDTTVPDRNDFYSSNVAPDKTHNFGSYLAARVPPSEQTCCSCDPAVTQCGKELPQEVAEIVRETVIQPKSEFLEFSAGLEKLLKEAIETPSSKYESDTGTLSPSKLTGTAEVSRQAASEFHREEIKETVKKSEAPSITESAFNIGFDRLFRETSEAPSYQLQVSVKEETPEKETSQSEQASFLRTVPHFDSTASEASEMKLTSNVFKSQVNQCDEVLGGDKAVTDLSVDLCGSESGVEIPGTPQFYVEHKIGITDTRNPTEDRDSESEGAGVREGASQEPGLEEAPKAISVSRNRQPISLLTNTENPTETSNIELILASPCKRIEKTEEKEGFSDSDISGGNLSSNAESWRKTSSSEEEPSPVLKTLERSAARKMPSKSLEDISSDSPNQAKVDNLPEELVRSAEDDQKPDQEPDTNESIPGISTVPSQPDNPFSHPDKLKRMSKSVPAFLQDESDDRETDTASESSYQLSRHKKSPSSLTNLSSSSGMTSLSSVSGSVMSVYSGDFGNLEVKGNIQFAVDYVDSLKELHVFVAQCKDLAAADVKKQRSDPYVKTYLLPDKGKMGKKKTLVVKKTLNPVYNEILRYKIEKQILKTQKLNLSVWHRDTFKRNSFLGEVELDLETWDWDNKQNKQLKWYPLKRKTAPVALEAENRGEMKLALQYVPEPIPGKKLPTTGEVHIWVKECLDLPQLRGSHLNSFVKCIILPDTSRKSRQKTRAVGKTTNPVFNHTMVYDGFRPEDLTEACVELTVWDHYKLTNQFLGGLRIGFGTGKSYGTEVDWMDSTSEEVALWEKMVNSPNTWIEATLPLRMLLIAKISK